MKIGSLYKVKKFHWLLFPTKETVASRWKRTRKSAIELARLAAATAGCWSRHCNCEVTYFSPDSIIVLLEEDGIHKKVLTSDGRIGWTWLDASHNNCFEEVKKES